MNGNLMPLKSRGKIEVVICLALIHAPEAVESSRQLLWILTSKINDGMVWKSFWFWFNGHFGTEMEGKAHDA
ncbi:hypothetical protein HQN90_31965 [Paenibacillus alba]|nr:hypothetical protein [Paenibacillus alba]